MTMRRRMTENAPRVLGFIQDEMDRARIYFEEHYNEDISIEQYAVSRNMSTSWFNRSFRSAMGTSPMKYILDNSGLAVEAEFTDENIRNIYVGAREGLEIQDGAILNPSCHRLAKLIEQCIIFIVFLSSKIERLPCKLSNRSTMTEFFYLHGRRYQHIVIHSQ